VSSALDLKNPVIAKMKNKQCGLNEFDDEIDFK